MRLPLLAALLACAGCASGPSDDAFLALAKKCDTAPGAANCAAAGDHLWTHKGRPLVACKDRLTVACQRAGEERTAAGRRIERLAYEYHDRACLFGHADACNKAGIALAIEYSVAPETEAPERARQAESRFEKACQLGSKEGCRHVGTTRAVR